MASTYTVNLGIEKIATGEQSGTWGTTTNTNFDIIDQAINGAVAVTLASAGTSGSPNTLAITDGSTSDGRNKFIDFNDGGDLGATAYVQLTPNDAEKIVHIRNSLSGGRTLILFQGTYNASNDFEVPNGKDVVLKFDGAGASATVTQVYEDLLVTAVAATTVDTTNIEVTNLKAKDGTAAGSIADATGVVTLSSSVLTTTDINGGTIDGAALGASTAITALTVDGLIKLDGNLDANNNVALGNTALDSLTTGINNTAVGSGALTAATAGSANVAVGFEALYSNTTGSSNVAQGYRALYSNTAGFSNVALGTNALENNTIGFRNVAIGDEALESNTTSHSNTALGYRALYNNITGSENTALGREAGDVITTGSDNTIIGYNADPSAAAAAGQIVIGSGVTGTADNRITVGSGANIAELDLDGSDTSWAASSDERLKKNIADYTAGVAFISELRPVTYQWRAKCDVPEELSLHDDSDDPVHGKPDVTYHGFVAQEVKQALDNHPEVADGQHFWKLRDDGVQTVAPADLVPILVNAVKELTSRLEAAEAEIQTLKGA